MDQFLFIQALICGASRVKVKGMVPLKTRTVDQVDFHKWRIALPVKILKSLDNIERPIKNMPPLYRQQQQQQMSSCELGLVLCRMNIYRETIVQVTASWAYIFFGVAIFNIVTGTDIPGDSMSQIFVTLSTDLISWFMLFKMLIKVSYPLKSLLPVLVRFITRWNL